MKLNQGWCFAEWILQKDKSATEDRVPVLL